VTVTGFLLVPSPLLGPSTWRPTAEWLLAAGHRAAVVDTTGVTSATDLAERVVAVAAAESEPVVLVPHSNAGLSVPLVGAQVDLRATVFVDAALPLESGDTALAPSGLLAHLETLADDDGLLPPWTQWWDDLTGLFPDAATRAEVEAEQPRLPLAYFRARLPVPDGWADGRCAYLAFGDTYAEEVAFARMHHWPVRVVAGRHLHLLHDPAGVGAAVVDLAELP
jgi:hypothetical protein